MKTSTATALAFVCLGITGCGGSSSPSGPSTPAPVPTPTPVTYNGNFSGVMTVTGAGIAALPVTGSTTVSQTGNAITLSTLTVSGALSGTFGAGSGTLSGNTFTATGAYNSAGCGVVNSAWTGYFSGDGGLMNLKVVLTSPSCADFQFLGELSR